jgi:hypothetical protein
MFEAWTIQLIASSYTDYAILVHHESLPNHKKMVYRGTNVEGGVGGADKGNLSQTLVLSSIPWVCSQTGIIHPDMKQYAI